MMCEITIILIPARPHDERLKTFVWLRLKLSVGWAAALLLCDSCWLVASKLLAPLASLFVALRVFTFDCFLFGRTTSSPLHYFHPAVYHPQFCRGSYFCFYLAPSLFLSSFDR